MDKITTPIASVFSHLLSPSSPTASRYMKGDDLEPLVERDDGLSEKVEFRIEGMTCGACVESIESMLREQAGIHTVKVALLAERAVIEFDPTTWTIEKIASEICDMGFDAFHIPPVRTDEVTLRIYGMTCSACTSTIETEVGATPGVLSVSVSLATEAAKIVFDRKMLGVRDLVTRVEELGFDAVISDESNATQLRSLTRTKEIHEWRDRFKAAVGLALPVFFIGMIFPMIPGLRPLVRWKIMQGLYLGDLISLLFTIPAQFWLGQRFYRNAWKAVRHGSATMDVLVVVGTTSAFTYSVGAMIVALFDSNPDAEPSVFFDTSTMLIMFVSLGRYLENMAKGKTSAALTDLMALAPSMATIYTDAPACTQERKIATELVQVGDIVKIVPGSQVPADGTVTKGTSSVDESPVTGEPVPVLKQVGDSVIGGTVNGAGSFDMVVTRAGKDTALAQIVKLVEDAQTSKAPIQEFADKVAGMFVPFVISLGAITFVVWMILSNVIGDEHLPMIFMMHGQSKLAVCLKLCISVVVVACPCALGLSTPTAIMVGTGVGAKNGILIKGGRALEASKNIKKIVFDKTGTVTEGKMTLTAMAWAKSHTDASHEEDLDIDSASPSRPPSNGLTDLDRACVDGVTSRLHVLALIAAAEGKSEHPLARAVAMYGKEVLAKTPGGDAISTDVTTFESVTGQGVKAQVSIKGANVPHSTYDVYVGSSTYITSINGLRSYLPTALSLFQERESGMGRTVILVAISSSSAKVQPTVALSLSDVPKKTSARAIAALQAMGIECCMMTGDGEATALAIAKQVGIPKGGVWASMTPKGKATKITELMESGQGVAMVGDGINDSPALVAATAGIALSSGTSVAIEAADIVLMRSDLLDVVAALYLSRSIFSVIRRNLIWACIYNVLGIPLAMGFFLPWGLHLHPMMASAAMAFSSVSVVMSSLTLKWWKRPQSSVMPGVRVEGPTMWDSVRETWKEWRSRRPGGGDHDGYSQIPLEMDDRV